MASPEPLREDIFAPGGQLYPSGLNGAATRVLEESVRLARETRWECLRSPHLFMGLLAVPDPSVRYWGDRLGADLTKLLGQFQELFNQDDGACDALLKLNREFMSDNAIRVLREARARAGENQRAFITPMDLLITLLTTSNSIVVDCFESIGVTSTKLIELAVIAEQQAM